MIYIEKLSSVLSRRDNQLIINRYCAVKVNKLLRWKFSMSNSIASIENSRNLLYSGVYNYMIKTTFF